MIEKICLNQNLNLGLGFGQNISVQGLNLFQFFKTIFQLFILILQYGNLESNPMF